MHPYPFSITCLLCAVLKQERQLCQLRVGRVDKEVFLCWVGTHVQVIAAVVAAPGKVNALSHKATILFEGRETVARCSVALRVLVVIAPGIASIPPLRYAVLRLLHPVRHQGIILVPRDRNEILFLPSRQDASRLPSPPFSLNVGL